MARERTHVLDGLAEDRLGGRAATAAKNVSDQVGPKASDSSQVTTPDAPTEAPPPVAPPESGGPASSVKTKPARPRLDRMPPWNVLLHNDDKNEMGYVIEAIIELTSLNPHDALIKMVEAHKTGVALLLTVHREFAELLQEQFASKGLIVSIEPDR